MFSCSSSIAILLLSCQSSLFSRSGVAGRCSPSKDGKGREWEGNGQAWSEPRRERGAGPASSLPLTPKARRTAVGRCRVEHLKSDQCVRCRVCVCVCVTAQ
ncbi:hypothetical protein BDP55DRAFT_131985 [Colletotrichum godetiae]|uniref:Secreted protein n=1 Tax=Colletotrichum godetiae TaxID=1209918 RepID=A0AAJ0AY32_9PEZI|nr:uncharacterized protein BDP55DRAFT_131985 [Colletotrichum godetiae]KAK1700435.1 hypothetical protein BDP55DRAFT_131985 [Colletotrichum godetiae]